MFWSNQTLKKRIKDEGIITDFDPDCVKYCAYELKLGDEAFLTSSEEGKKDIIDARGQIVIEPGQFALLITKETFKIPSQVLCFISVKASIKFRGLINVSGFHVDPGFRGKLKFSVYNAGGQNIVLSRDDVVFIIFFADLDLPADPPYDGQHQDQSSITAKDVMEIQGKLASPTVLDERIKNLEKLVEIWTRVFQALGAGCLLILIGLTVKSCSSADSARSTGENRTNTPAAFPSLTNAASTVTNPGFQLNVATNKP